jgi:hypothetical protein
MGEGSGPSLFLLHTPPARAAEDMPPRSDQETIRKLISPSKRSRQLRHTTHSQPLPSLGGKAHVTFPYHSLSRARMLDLGQAIYIMGERAQWTVKATLKLDQEWRDHYLAIPFV